MLDPALQTTKSPTTTSARKKLRAAAQQLARTPLAPLAVGLDNEDFATPAPQSPDEKILDSEKANWRASVKATFKNLVSLLGKGAQSFPSIAAIAAAAPFPRSAKDNCRWKSDAISLGHNLSEIRSKEASPSALEKLRGTLPGQRRRALGRFHNDRIEQTIFVDSPSPRSPPSFEVGED